VGGRSGGRPKGAKNTSTVWREAQGSLVDGTLVLDAADPIDIIENFMRYFYAIGLHGAKSKAPVDEVQKCFQKALYAASLAAPYRHARLSAVKHLEQADSIDGISANATAEELRAEIAKRIRQMLKETKKINKRGRTKAMRPAEPSDQHLIWDM
jgi:hypothetical protein